MGAEIVQVLKLSVQFPIMVSVGPSILPSFPYVGTLALEGLLEDGCAKHCPSRPLENPDSSSEYCRSDPVVGEGLMSSWGGGSWKDSREIAVLGKVRSQTCCMAGVQKYDCGLSPSKKWGWILGGGGWGAS